MTSQREKPPAMSASRVRRRRRRRDGRLEVDVKDILEASVRVRHGDVTQTMAPFEAMVRQHVKKSLIKRSVASMKFVTAQAERFHLFKPPVKLPQGGAIIVPKDMPEELQREIFDHDDRGDRMERVFNAFRRYCDGLRKR